MERNFRFVNLFNEFFVLEAFHRIDGDDDFAVLRHEFFHDMDAFTEELAFAFTSLFGCQRKQLAEPRRVGSRFRNLFRLGSACFQGGFIQILVNQFGLLFGALAVHRETFIASAFTGVTAVTAKTATTATERLVAKAARTAFAVKTRLAFVAAAIFTESTDSTGAIATERAFTGTHSITGGIVTTGATFVPLFAHAELVVQGHLHCAFLFFAHNFSINWFATDSPSIFNSLYRLGISPCSTKWSGRPKRNSFLSVKPRSCISSMTAEP